MERWCWVELIGFDNTSRDYGVGDYLSRISDDVTGVSLFLYSAEFILSYRGYSEKRKLSPEYCSYGAHPNNEERERQDWTYGQLKGLVSELQKRGIKVVFSTFSTFTYRNRSGEVVVGAFGGAHTDIRENITCMGGNYGTVSMIKRFRDGSSFSDYFLAQIKKILTDFEFDGVHFADGLSFPGRRIQDGDYSDDLVLRFSEQTGISLPAEISGACDEDPERLQKRYEYILTHYRAEYTEFHATLYAEFATSAYRALAGKIVLFMGAWTRDPFECYFRYGIDNRKMAFGNAHAFVFENMAASMSVFSVQESGGVAFSEEFRQNVLFHFFVTLASLKSYTPEAEILNLTPIKDTCEQWNMIDNHPNGLAKGIALRNSNFIYRQGKLVKSTAGAMYCLADGLKSEKWDFLNVRERRTDLCRAEKVYGCGFLFHDRIEREAADYIATRKLFGHEIRKRIVSAGVTLTFACDLESLPAVDQPLIVTGSEYFGREDLAALSAHKGSFAVIGYENPLTLKPDCEVLLQGSDFKCSCYNLSRKRETIVLENGSGQTDLSPYDENGGIWTAKLKFETINPEFFETVGNILNGEISCFTDKKHCRVMLFDTGEKYRLYVYNNAHHFEVTKVFLPMKARKAQALFYPTAVQEVGENYVKVKIFNDGVEIVEFEKG